MAHEEDELTFVLRHHNRAQRRVNKTLRRALSNVMEYSDNLFKELCDTNKEAELAMEKLWTLGGFEEKCGPLDYDYVVEACLKALANTP